MLCDDINRCTVVRAELSCAEALRAEAYVFYDTCLRDMRRGDLQRLTVHAFRSDATNASAWHQTRVFASEGHTAHIHAWDPEDDSTAFSLTHDCHHLRRACDILPAVDCTGPGTMNNLRKQLHNYGYPDWRRPSQHVVGGSIEVWLYTSDQ